MSNQLSPQLLAQLYAQESSDPFLTLITLSHPSFPQDLRLVNNQENIVSNGNTFQAFPVRIQLPVDDGETVKEVLIEFDNVSLELIDEIRSVSSSERIGVKLEMILASLPNDIQISLEDLYILNITYNATIIQARIGLDDFLSTELTSEVYSPSNFPGIF